ncbi:uncharacterized protein [Diabrotica undecimpunctata]|uniref:uncharacterized protein n=1 Tax=Diabrotica undecimpunctata TaxID=50387 RepID=UPI003B633217
MADFYKHGSSLTKNMEQTSVKVSESEKRGASSLTKANCQQHSLNKLCYGYSLVHVDIAKNAKEWKRYPGRVAMWITITVPLGEHAGRFNAPTVDEVAVIMVGDPVDKRSIKITRRDNTLSTISDLHRSYDALQYPLIFWEGQDEYHLNIKQYDPNTGDYRNNKVSSMKYYAHRIMVTQHQDNYILRYRQLFHQYIVDMYAKVESERLRFLRFNQAKLRSEEYIHLRDAVAGNIDGNLNPNDIGNAFILPSSYIGSPRNMQEYIQDAMTYVRHYGRPDLFITFTCNSNWEEIQTLLLPGQQAIHRYDLTARSHLAIFEVQNINKNDEIARYQMGRYISSNEAIWHILSFPIHERDPAVQHLAIHLENGQRVYFTEENVLQRAFEAPKTTLTEFFTLCQKPDVFGQFAKILVFGDVPRYFTWNKSINGRVFNTYQDACRELQLLEDDNHWDLTLADAALTSTPNNIRQLFAIILTTCYPSQAQTLWEKYKNCMTQDILHRIRQTNQCQNIDYTPEMYNEALVLIEDLCVLISNLPLNHYGMPSPNRPATDLVNTNLQRENQYDHGSLATIIMNSEPLLTAEQKIIYDRIMLAVAAEQGGFFSWMHPVEPLPLDVRNKPDAMCNIKKNNGIGAVLRKSSIIIWDECTMAHKYSLETLNRTMQDLNSNNKLFGGAILLLSGDFRQTLPVIPRSTFADEINACLKQSFLWRSVETLRLTINMRVQLQNDPSAQIFSEQLLDIGNDFTKPFKLTTDASNFAIETILSQSPIGNDKPIAYASRTLNETELKYSTIEKEMLEITWAT